MASDGDNPPIGTEHAIGVIGIVTRDRVASLAECADSYLRNCGRHGRSPRFIVTDDSANEATRTETRTALRHLRDRHRASISYTGRSERIRFVEALAQESAVPIEVVRFGLLGDDRCRLSTGANRNGLLLETLDTLALSVDDDTRCDIALPPGADSAPASFPGYDPTEIWFFADRRRALDSVAFVDLDVLQCHEAMLGRSVADDDDARVAFTLHGIVGDSGMGSPRYFLGLEGATRERLVASAEAYRSAFRSREVIRAVQRPTSAATPFCMTTCFGFDNRSPLPPFFPVQRNSDGIFGLVLQKCVAGSRVGFLPSVIVHRPEPPRAFAPDEMWSEAGTTRLADAVMAFTLGHHAENEPRAAMEGIPQLGRYFRELGALPLVDFDVRLRSLQQYRAMSFLTVLQSQMLRHGGLPSFWADDVRRMIDLLGKAVVADDYAVPRDLREGRSLEEARRLGQELIGRFGELLEAWPAMVAAARRLRTQGRGLTVAV